MRNTKGIIELACRSTVLMMNGVAVSHSLPSLAVFLTKRKGLIVILWGNIAGFGTERTLNIS